MIELGLVGLVQADATVNGISPNGGYFVEVPKGATLPTWTYRVVSNESEYTLGGRPGLSMSRFEINCYSTVPGDVLTLASAIDKVLSGYTGTLNDPDSTVVSGCFGSDIMDFFDDVSRSYRRMIEFEVWYSQN